MTDLLTKEVADRFRVSPQTIRRWASTGRLKGWHAGRGWRFPVAEVERLEAEFKSKDGGDSQ